MNNYDIYNIISKKIEENFEDEMEEFEKILISKELNVDVNTTREIVIAFLATGIMNGKLILRKEDKDGIGECARD